MRKQNLRGAPLRFFGLIPEFVPIKTKFGYVQNRVVRVKLWFITFLDELDNFETFERENHFNKS